jgi:hypothetical protein
MEKKQLNCIEEVIRFGGFYPNGTHNKGYEGFLRKTPNFPFRKTSHNLNIKRNRFLR